MSRTVARWLEGEGHRVARLGSRMGYRLLEEGKTMALASYGSDRFVDAQ